MTEISKCGELFLRKATSLVLSHRRELPHRVNRGQQLEMKSLVEQKASAEYNPLSGHFHGQLETLRLILGVFQLGVQDPRMFRELGRLFTVNES